jgi:hypothetical protein
LPTKGTKGAQVRIAARAQLHPPEGQAAIGPLGGQVAVGGDLVGQAVLAGGSGVARGALEAGSVLGDLLA